MGEDAVLSILLPVFEAEATLGACLRSIERQTEPRFECVIVDDGSRDGSLAVARRAAERDPRFRVLAAKHRGLVAALELGLAHCRGRLVARMDADDWMHRERLAQQRAALDADPGLAAVGSHVRCFPRAALGAGMRAYEGWLASIDSPECVRREGVVPRRLLGWRHGPRRLSRTDPRYAPERFTACKAEFLARGFLAGGERYLLWGYGGTGKALARALRLHGRRPSAIVELHPRRVGKTIAGAPVIHPRELPSALGAPLVVSVAGFGARSLIRGELARLALREGDDYVCAA